METFLYPSISQWNELATRPAIDRASLEQKVVPLLAQIKAGGDDVLKSLTKQFDGVELTSLLVTEQELLEAEELVSEDLKSSIKTAYSNIYTFHLAQKDTPNPIETMPGVRCWRESRAIDKVGLYIPGGTAPLFSTILMLGIPAKIAGCLEIVLCTPPNKEGKIHPAILYTASLVGVTKICKLGGIQAVGAMAYGSESVPSVYKIFGPGNQYVTMAKQLVSKEGIAIDMPAGPSEVAVIADATANPGYVAADLLSQAEHGVDSQVIVVTTYKEVIQPILDEVDRQVALLPRGEFALKALKNSKAIVFETDDQMIEFINQYAPEHLIIQTIDPSSYIGKIRNAGSVFLGAYTPESAGDYASGTNHTLPTNGYAHAYSGVSLDSFVKKITFQEISQDGLKVLGPVIMNMAEAEQLDAHALAVKVRLL